MGKEQIREVETLIRARYPIILLVSWEELRIEHDLADLANEHRRPMYVWTSTNGLVPHGGRMASQGTQDPKVALAKVAESQESALFLFKDFHSFLRDASVVRKVRDVVDALHRGYKSLLFVSPVLELPVEIEKDTAVIHYAPPGPEEIAEQLEDVVKSLAGSPNAGHFNVQLSTEEREAIIRAAQGLTAGEINTVLSRSLVERRRFDVEVILAEKEQIIRKSGILEYFRSDQGFTDIGGLDILKSWLHKRLGAFSERARQFGLPQPKGLLLLGVQGCGKSLTAKAVASLWKLPLLRLDVGRIFSGLVGSSEERMRKAIATAEAVAPVVLWVDEVDKGFAGTQSSSFSDAGTTSRVFGSFVTWLQEKDVPVFVIATANDVNMLPPELLRKGRFDDLFFVDLPCQEEREEIFRIHIAKRGREATQFDTARLAAASGGFSGAEIEQGVISAMYDAFEQERDIATDDILRAVQETYPLSATMRERIVELRSWARMRARQGSSLPAEELSFGFEEGDSLFPPAESGHTRRRASGRSTHAARRSRKGRG